MIGCIIQARIGSTRLPGKTLMKLNEHFSTLDFVINQLSFSKLIEKTIIATTTLEQDDVIEKYCRKLNIPCFRGNSDDVLDRYYQCAIFFKINHILRITSDCPLIDPEIVDKIIMKYQSGNYDYFTNTLTRTFPVGTDAEVFSFNTIKKSWENAKLPSEREHVTPFIRNKKMNFELGNLEHTKDLSFHRWTLDRKEDLELIKQIISKINKTPILIDDILNLFTNEPELIKINQNIPKDEGMLKSLKRDEEFQNLIDKNEK